MKCVPLDVPFLSASCASCDALFRDPHDTVYPTDALVDAGLVRAVTEAWIKKQEHGKHKRTLSWGHKRLSVAGRGAAWAAATRQLPNVTLPNNLDNLYSFSQRAHWGGSMITLF